jgi:hypothetical protein
MQNQSTTIQPAPLLAFHGKPAIKKTYIARVKAHRAADLLAQGATGVPSQGERGCAVACTVDGYAHARYPIELGIPVDLAHLEDRIFEGLPVADSQAWPEQFLRAIPVGADLSKVARLFAKRIAKEAIENHWPEGKYEAAPGDRNRILAWLGNDDCLPNEGIRRIAYAAAYAAYAAADADAADAAAYAAADADADARRLSRHESYQHMSKMLLKMLGETKAGA